MEHHVDRFGNFSITAFAAANVVYAIVSGLEDGIDRKKALATCSELTALAGGLRPEHPGWIILMRDGERFEDSFQHLSVSITVDETGAKLVYRHIWRELFDSENRWKDTEYAGEALISEKLDHDQNRVAEWVNYASLFFHRKDGIRIVTPKEQTWY
jgi:hypothetical protein